MSGGTKDFRFWRKHGFHVFLGASLCLFLMVSATNLHHPPAKQMLRVALTGKYPPFSFYSNEGNVCGFDVDVARSIAESTGRQLEITTTEWDGILAGLLADKYDAIIGSMAVTPERSRRVDFSDSYYVSGAQVFVRDSETNTFSSILDLEEHSMGVGLGETYEHFLRSKYPRIHIVTYKSSVDIFQDMQNGRIDAFCTDRLVGLYQIKAGGVPFTPVGPLLYEERIAIPVAKANTVLLKQINAALKTLREDGRLAELHRKWFDASVHEETARIGLLTELRMLGRGFGITLAVAGAALLFGFTLALPWSIGLHHAGRALRTLLRFVNDFVRGTPLLIQLFFVYFGAPQVGVTLSPISSAVFTLSLNCAAYMSEVLRSGLMAVDPGQRRAGQALGLSSTQVFRFVVWPQAFRVAMPSLMNIVVAFIKDTALISVISVAEVVREAQSIISVTFNPLKYYFIVAGMFFAITFPLMKLAGVLERRIKAKGFQHD